MSTIKLHPNRRKTTEEFVSLATKVHSGKYTYELSDYTLGKNKIQVTCPVHGPFWLRAEGHTRGIGCNSCKEDAKWLTQQEFIDKANEKHLGRYDYSDVVYTRNSEKVSIICKDHGAFPTIAANHLNGTGCPICNPSGYRSERPGTLYILRCGDITKVGITSLEVNKRVRQISRSSGMNFKPYLTFYCSDGNVAPYVERKALIWLKNNFIPCREKFDGYTECFLDVDIVSLVNLVAPLIPEPPELAINYN